MASEPNFEVNNLSISETSRLGLNGQSTRLTVIRYYVGDHGPFTWEIPSKDFTPAAARAAMADKAAQLRATLT